MRKERLPRTQSNRELSDFIPNQSLHPSHWHSYQRNLRKAEEKKSYKERVERRLKHGEELGVFAEQQGRSSIWDVSDWWTGELLLRFCNATGKYETAAGGSGRIEPENLRRAMEVAVGRKRSELDHQRSLLASAGMVIEASEHPYTWNCCDTCDDGDGSDGAFLVSFQRQQEDRYSIIAPTLLQCLDVTFRSVIDAANRRRLMPQAGFVVALRETASGVIERFLITTAERSQGTDDAEPLPYFTELGKQIAGRRLGDRFTRHNVEYEVIEISSLDQQ